MKKKLILLTVLVMIVAAVPAVSFASHGHGGNHHISCPASKGVTSTKAGCMKIKWSKKTGVTGYKILFSKNKNYSGCKTIYVKNKNAVSVTVKNLTPGKRYYAKVCAYKVINGKKVYSNYCKSRSCTVKKATGSGHHHGYGHH